MKTNGYRKIFIGFVYLAGMFGLAALEIVKHTPADLVGLGALASGLALGVGTVMWGNAKEHEHAATAKQTTP